MRHHVATALALVLVTRDSSTSRQQHPVSCDAPFLNAQPRAGAITMLARKKSNGKRQQQRNAQKKKVAARGFAKRDDEATEEGSRPFIAMPRMTHVVFRSPVLSVVEVDGAKAVIATQHIAAGEVLLLEHVVSGTSDYALNCVLNDGPLFDVLHPRTTTWSVERLLADELESMVCDKVDANGFVGSDGSVAVGSAISAFNHDDRPQAVVRSLSVSTDEMVEPPRLLYVLACETVLPNEEIRIQYRDGPSALHPYVMAAGSSMVADASSKGAEAMSRAREGGAALTVGTRKAARGWRGGCESGEADGGRVQANSAELQAGADAVRDLVLEYATTEAYVRLCVAHDRLRRALIES
jgi:hypothetical protein